MRGGRQWTVQPVPGPIAAIEVSGLTWALGCPHTNNGSCRPVLARKLTAGGDWREL